MYKLYNTNVSLTDSSKCEFGNFSSFSSHTEQRSNSPLRVLSSRKSIVTPCDQYDVNFAEEGEYCVSVKFSSIVSSHHQRSFFLDLMITYALGIRARRNDISLTRRAPTCMRDFLMKFNVSGEADFS